MWVCQSISWLSIDREGHTCKYKQTNGSSAKRKQIRGSSEQWIAVEEQVDNEYDRQKEAIEPSQKGYHSHIYKI